MVAAEYQSCAHVVRAAAAGENELYIGEGACRDVRYQVLDEQVVAVQVVRFDGHERKVSIVGGIQSRIGLGHADGLSLGYAELRIIAILPDFSFPCDASDIQRFIQHYGAVLKDCRVSWQRCGGIDYIIVSRRSGPRKIKSTGSVIADVCGSGSS